MEKGAGVGQFWTPIQAIGGSLLHAGLHMAFYDPADIAGANISGPQDIPNLPEDVRRAIIGWSWDKQGNFILKLSPKTPSLELLGRHLILWRDVGSRENPLTVDSLSDEELSTRLAELEAKR